MHKTMNRGSLGVLTSSFSPSPVLWPDKIEHARSVPYVNFQLEKRKTLCRHYWIFALRIFIITEGFSRKKEPLPIFTPVRRACYKNRMLLGCCYITVDSAPAASQNVARTSIAKERVIYFLCCFSNWTDQFLCWESHIKLIHMLGNTL
jgi:hypothetical protein